jgi:hypothetical protein
MGYYPYHTTNQELQELKTDEAFTKLMCASVEGWIHVTEERIRGGGIQCYISPGNDEGSEIDLILSGSDYVIIRKGE